MRSEEEIREMIETFKFRLNFFEQERIEEFEETGKISHNPNMPDAIEESANKIMALEWVLGEIDDLFAFPQTLKGLNCEKFCANLLKKVNEEIAKEETDNE